MNTLEISNIKIPLNSLLQTKFNDFKILNHIKDGSFGDVFSAKHPSTADFIYAIKTIRLRAKDSDDDIRNELSILEKIHALKYHKPKSLPKYFGFHQEINKFSQITYNIIMEYLPKNLEEIIKNHRETGNLFPFQRMKKYNV